MRISDWSSDVCSSDLDAAKFYAETFADSKVGAVNRAPADSPGGKEGDVQTVEFTLLGTPCVGLNGPPIFKHSEAFSFMVQTDTQEERSEEHTSELQSLMRISYAVFCLKKKNTTHQTHTISKKTTNKYNILNHIYTPS